MATDAGQVRPDLADFGRGDEPSDGQAFDAERARLEDARGGVPWKKWGPYLAERAWGTVREDYSDDGDAWGYFTHDQARMRAYRWTEDGLGGLCDERQRLCLALAVWNERDPILKERAFGLSNAQGNHGEDVKELYFHLDAVPTSSYLRFAYLYPQRPFPYADLVAENARRTGADPEYELLDTGIFDDGRYFDVEVTYAKAAPEAILMRLSATNRGPDAAPLHLLPTVWFRNTWAWAQPREAVPSLRLEGGEVRIDHPTLGRYRLAARADGADPTWVFTDNETNATALFGPSAANASPFTKDAFHRWLIDRDEDAVNPARHGTKAAAHARWVVGPGQTVTMTLALLADEPEERSTTTALLDRANEIVESRRAEADAFYEALAWPSTPPEERAIQRQALAGMLWSLQYYEYDVARWQAGDALPPPPGHARSRNRTWRGLRAHDVLSVPDTWEYPWFAAWDLAFHAVTLGLVDPDRAKAQLLSLLDDRYMNADGQLPAYEWEFSDLNPPVQAWAALRVYRRDALVSGRPDRPFLERMLHGLMLAFGWWVNREDARGDDIFEGGFLGLDNISLVDRSAVEGAGMQIEQADATGWMAAFALALAEMAIELAREERVYVELAKHFLDRFVAIGEAIDGIGGMGLWNEEAGFFFDVLPRPDGSAVQLTAFSVVGLVPLFATRVTDPELLAELPEIDLHLQRLAERHPGFFGQFRSFLEPNDEGRKLLSLVDEGRLSRILDRVLAESRFLSPHGVRSLSKGQMAGSVAGVELDGQVLAVSYEPAESVSRIKGGNSNWRGPVWLPINYLLVQALRQFGRYHGPGLSHALPSPDVPGKELRAIADEIAQRVVSLYTTAPDGLRAAMGPDPRWRDAPGFCDRLLFYEYFHGDTGQGLGASHQTGWTGLIANLIDELHRPGR